MISQNSVSEIKNSYPFINEFPEKLQSLIFDEIPPDGSIIKIYKINIRDNNGCIIVLENKVLSFWMSKLLFKKFPTIQEINFIQINTLNVLNEKEVYIHASADPNIKDENYEESKFSFNSSIELNEFLEYIKSKSPRLS